MPSIIGHALIGAASGWALPRKLLPKQAVLVGAVCSMFPDIDVIGLRMGIPYHHWLGHRGFSHSIAFAIMVAALMTLVSFMSPRFSGSRPVLFLYLAACTSTHGILDAMTTGGLGIAFLSPFSNERFFLPWRPIIVSPLDPRRLLSAWGLKVLFSELIWIGMPALLIVLTRLAAGMMGICRRMSTRRSADR